MKDATTDPANPNSGHGHVFPRPDGARARCGGPRMCQACAADLARKEAAIPNGPAIAVPANWEGTEAEAVALAVAGAVGAIQQERDQALTMLAELVGAFPETSWAQSADVKERAKALLEELGGAPDADS